jgi:hypothetical protein
MGDWPPSQGQIMPKAPWYGSASSMLRCVDLFLEEAPLALLRGSG